jgi:hypothetical protein
MPFGRNNSVQVRHYFIIYKGWTWAKAQLIHDLKELLHTRERP